MALVGDMNYLTINGDTYEIADADARQDLALKAPIASPALTGTPTAPTASNGDSSTQIATTAFVQNAMSGVGTVTSVGVNNDTYGGLSVSGSPVTSSGTITIGHSNVLTSAQTTSAVYPIKIDKNGHISEYGSAVTIPTKVSDLTNDSGYITTETDPTVPSWAKASTKPSYSASEIANAVYADGSYGNPPYSYSVYGLGQSTVEIPVYYTTHNITNSNQVTTKGYVDNAIGSITIPTKTSDLTNDSGYITSYTETDPIFSASPAAGITATDISNWNSKVSDDKTWNEIVLEKIACQPSGNITIPYIDSANNKANYIVATPNGGSANILPKYDTNGYLKSTTPSANDNSTKVATTAYVDAAIPDISGKLNKSGDTMTGHLIMDYTTGASSSKRIIFKYGDKNPDSVYFSIFGSASSNGIVTSFEGGFSTPIQLSGIATPENNTDAANKKYIDDSIGALSIPTISLNGSSTTSASFYAPTTAGTSGYYLKSNGSGAPSWTSFPTIVNTRGTPTSGGTTLSVVNTGDMYTWNNKSQVQIVTWSEEE